MAEMMFDRPSVVDFWQGMSAGDRVAFAGSRPPVTAGEFVDILGQTVTPELVAESGSAPLYDGMIEWFGTQLQSFQAAMDTGSPDPERISKDYTLYREALGKLEALGLPDDRFAGFRETLQTFFEQ